MAKYKTKTKRQTTMTRTGQQPKGQKGTTGQASVTKTSEMRGDMTQVNGLNPYPKGMA